MAVNKNSAAKKAAKKVNFFTCDGCFGIFTAGTGFQAPKNKYNLRQVCKSCYKQYISKTIVPLPAGAAQALKNQLGGFLTSGNAGILSNANAGILSNANGTFISEHGGALISNTHGGATAGGRLISNQAGIISDKGSGILSNANAGLISDKSGGFISDQGGGLIGKIR